MRILRVAQKIYPETPGGATYHVHALSRDQAAAGHDVTVLTLSEDPELPREETRDGYRLVRCRPTVTALGNTMSLGATRRILGASDYDVVHAHSHIYFNTNVAALKRRLGDTPLAITNHGLYSQSAPEKIFRAYLKTLGKWTFNQADVVFCYTGGDHDRLRRLGVTSRIEVVPNGVDTDRFTPHGPESDQITHDGPVVLFVGRLVQGKRPMDAVKAISRLSKKMDVKLYVVGDGPMRQELETTADESIVELLGHIPFDEMPRLYRSADALLLPSRAEGFPRTVLEAFSSGTPAVTSDLEQIAPIVEKAGYTFPIGDTDTAAQHLARILTRQEHRDELARRARKTVEHGFRWSDTARRTTNVLVEISN